ncbi:MAG: DUF308 domain-containing protein [Micromonosporaceae bacterium]|nr:DUF308 domain-containing protein [Micromonosporaceae bacterium]
MTAAAKLRGAARLAGGRGLFRRGGPPGRHHMTEEELARDGSYRWSLAMRGVAALAFGVVALVWPRVTVVVLALVFGAFAFVDGAGMLISVARGRIAARRRNSVLVAGVLGVVAGALALVWPGLTALILAVLIGSWAVLTGLLQVWSAVRQGRHWLVGLIGGLSMAAGILILLRPVLGVVAMARVIGAYAVITGVIMLVELARLVRIQPSLPWRSAGS